MALPNVQREGRMTRTEGTVYGDHRTVALDRNWPPLYADCTGVFRVESYGPPTVLCCDECSMKVGLMSRRARPASGGYGQAAEAS